jgi:hypothetical protein
LSNISQHQKSLVKYLLDEMFPTSSRLTSRLLIFIIGALAVFAVFFLVRHPLALGLIEKKSTPLPPQHVQVKKPEADVLESNKQFGLCFLKSQSWAETQLCISNERE